MYAGHFAAVPIIRNYYPNVSPFTLTFGVIFLDLAFASLTFLGFEGFTLNPHAGALGIDIHCKYSHSLLGSIILSVIYGTATGSFTPAFLASLSHFVGDWLVHNLDLPLDPFSGIMIGGTSIWGNYPTFAYYFELLFCIVLGLFGPKDGTKLYFILSTALLHLTSHDSSKALLIKTLSMPSESDRQKYTALAISSSFIIPAILLAYLIRKTKVKTN